MSATEVPILDPKNMMFDLPNSRGGITTSVFYDPVAKLSASVGGGGASIILDEKLGFDGGAERSRIHFIPKLNREILVTGDIWTLFREKEIIEAPLVNITIKYKYIDDMRMGFVDANSTMGIGFQPVFPGYGYVKEGYPGFEFWPDGVPGRNKALAIYMLYGLIPMIERSIVAINRAERGDIKRIAIAIDKRLMDLTGPEAFPYNEAVGDNHTMILKGDEINV